MLLRGELGREKEERSALLLQAQLFQEASARAQERSSLLLQAQLFQEASHARAQERAALLLQAQRFQEASHVQKGGGGGGGGGGGLQEALAEALGRGVRDETVECLGELARDLQAVLALVSQAKAEKERLLSVPDSFRCPITQEVMTDPVMVAETGHTYERAAILRWLQTNSTDPKTNVPLQTKQLVPNHGLRATIEDFLNPPIRPIRP
ncbi:hypothetical protein T484DRAFT_1894077 [Baffinella frigidus]|nr:hypothetical protein T484DRAFT_1894077 [Cryptophyta sp. CCMP2293]